MAQFLLEYRFALRKLCANPVFIAHIGIITIFFVRWTVSRIVMRLLAGAGALKCAMPRPYSGIMGSAE
jgi:hypothetical protein